MRCNQGKCQAGQTPLSQACRFDEECGSGKCSINSGEIGICTAVGQVDAGPPDAALDTSADAPVTKPDASLDAPVTKPDASLDMRADLVTARNTVTTFAGTGSSGKKDAPVASATFASPSGVAATAGAVFVAQNLGVVRVVRGGAVTSLGSTDFGDVTDVAVTSNGTIYVADESKDVIHAINGTTVTRFAGTGAVGFKNGPVGSATFANPCGIAVDAAGAVYVADCGNHSIRKISAGQVSTLAGSGIGGHNNGQGTVAQFREPRGLDLDTSGNVYVADRQNHQIRKITSGGLVSTLAGIWNNGFPKPGLTDGAATAAQFNNPYDVAVDSPGGVLYVAERVNHRIRKVDLKTGQTTTAAGSGAPSLGKGYFGDGAAAAAGFDNPEGLAFFGGKLYVADRGNNRVRLYTP